MRANRFLFLTVLFGVSMFFVPRSSPAVAGSTRVKYYDTCGPNRVLVGVEYDDCYGNYTSWGVETNYVMETDKNCATGVSINIFTECGVQVSSLDDCIC
jgi:hypothetical protein